MEKLNFLETSLIECILAENKEKYSFLNSHISHLYIQDREYTGVGVYSNFGYTMNHSRDNINNLLSSKKTLTIDGIRHGLSYVLSIEEGRIDSLEVVTNGNELWNGEFAEFKLE